MASVSTLGFLKLRLYTKSRLFNVKLNFGHKISYLKSRLYCTYNLSQCINVHTYTNRILLNGSDESSQPIFEYVYSYDGTLSAVDSLRLGPTSFVLKMAAKKIFGWDIFDLDLGVAHAEEMFLMFKHHIIPTDTIFTPEEALVSQRLVKIVSNFARTKNPNSEGDEKNAWKAVTKNERLAFNITAEPQMEMTENEPHLKRNDFWNRILDEIVVYRNYLSEKPPLLREEVENIVIKDEL